MRQISLDDIPAGGLVEDFYWPEEDTLIRFTGAAAGQLCVQHVSASPSVPLVRPHTYAADSGLFEFMAACNEHGQYDIGDLHFDLRSGDKSCRMVLRRSLRDPDQTVGITTRSKRKPDPGAYAMSETWSQEEERFNNEFRLTRAVSCCALTIELGNPDKPLARMLANTMDLQSLTLIADRVLIAGAVSLPQTSVQIYARVVEFAPGSQIDTSAIHDEVWADECIAGDAGAAGGSVLFRAEKVVGTPRVTSNGAKGQRGGNGVTGKPEKWGETYPYTTTIIKRRHFMQPPMELKVDTALSDQQRQILDCAVYVEYWDREGEVEKPYHLIPELHNVEKDWGSWSNFPPFRTHEPAGQGGKGGDGGTIGGTSTVVTDDPADAAVQARRNERKVGHGRPTSTRPLRVLFPGGVVTASGGEAGANGQPGTPLDRQLARSPATPCRAKLMYWRGVGSDIANAFIVTATAAPRQEFASMVEPAPAAAGRSTPFVRLAGGWCHPALVTEVCDHAQKLFRAGYLEEAKTLVTTYDTALKEGHFAEGFTASDFAAEGATLSALGQLLASGLDAFGKRPGWVPVLSFEWNLQLSQKTIETAIPTLCFARWLNARYDQLTTASLEWDMAIDRLAASRKALADEHNAALGALDGIRKEIDSAELQKQSLEKSLRAKERELLDDVTAAEQYKATWKGVLNILSGVLQLVPFGQPVTGMVGQGANILGAIDGTKSLDDNLKAMQAEGLDKLAEKAIQAGAAHGSDRLRDQVARLDDQYNILKTQRKTECDAKMDQAAERKKRLDAIAAQRTADHGKVLGDLRGSLNLAATATDAEVLTKLKQAGRQDEYRRRLNAAGKDRVATRQQNDTTSADWKKEDARLDELAAARKKPLTDFSDQLKLVSDQAASGVASLTKGISALSVPSSTIDAEMAKARKNCPAYAELIAQIETVSKARGSAALLLVASLGKVQSTLARMGEIQASIARITAARDGALRVLDPSMYGYFKAIERDAVEQLARMQYYLAKAYEYRLLRPCTNADFLLNDLTESVDKLCRAAPATGTPDPKLQSMDLVFTPDKIVNVQQTYQAQLQLIVGELVKVVNTTDIPSTQVTQVSLDEVQLAQLNSTGTTTFNLMEAGQLDPSDQDVRLLSIGLDENDGVRLILPPAEIKLEFALVHDGHSILRSEDTLFSFLTKVRDGPNSTQEPMGRAWGATCMYSDGKLKIANSSPDVGNGTLLDLLVGEATRQKGDAAGQKVVDPRYTAPAAWANIRVSRTIAPPRYNGSVTLKKVRLALHLSKRHRTDDAVKTLTLVSNSGLRPYLSISPLDKARRGDGRATALRVFDAGERVVVQAPATCAGERFQYWETFYGSGGRTPARSDARRQELACDGHMTMQAMYGEMGAHCAVTLLERLGFSADGDGYSKDCKGFGQVHIAATPQPARPGEVEHQVLATSLVLTSQGRPFPAVPGVGGFGFATDQLGRWILEKEDGLLHLLQKEVPRELLSRVTREGVNELDYRGKSAGLAGFLEEIQRGERFAAATP